MDIPHDQHWKGYREKQSMAPKIKKAEEESGHLNGFGRSPYPGILLKQYLKEYTMSVDWEIVEWIAVCFKRKP